MLTMSVKYSQHVDGNRLMVGSCIICIYNFSVNIIQDSKNVHILVNNLPLEWTSH